MIYKTFMELYSHHRTTDRSFMDETEERAWNEDCFDTYENIGFCETFYSEDEDMQKYIGMKFEVKRRLDESEVDRESLPMWHITFENGDECDAFPEEICIYERRKLYERNQIK